tara:strand:- start:173 stop:895 length:723 start_codon:yes stop_codon:yes gene_type:complete
MNKKEKDFKSYLKNLESIKNYIPKVNSAGYPFIIIFFVVALVMSMISDFLGWIGFILTVWCVYFFRDPERVTPNELDAIISPADGKIISCSEEESPEIIHNNKQKKMTKVSIFMDVFNVHVNRIPISGTIKWLKYIPGTFINASLDKASEDNERMITKILTENKQEIYIVQIAGLIARRIKCDLEENQSVEVGNRFGLIRFGSRVDLYIPNQFVSKVLIGQTVIAGETVIAKIINLTSRK